MKRQQWEKKLKFAIQCLYSIVAGKIVEYRGNESKTREACIKMVGINSLWTKESRVNGLRFVRLSTGL